ncbi:MAG: hypothetical protein AAF171_07205 [Cyanobacteria bacterium P01_A01_bin.116]
MDTMIETIVIKLRRLSGAKLQLILEFVNFLDWQEMHAVPSAGKVSVASSLPKMTEHERQVDWKDFINECSGAFPDFPTVEEIRADTGEDAEREQF